MYSTVSILYTYFTQQKKLRSSEKLKIVMNCWNVKCFRQVVANDIISPAHLSLVSLVFESKWSKKIHRVSFCYLRRRRSCFHLHLSVGLFVCKQYNSKSYPWIFFNFGGEVDKDPKKGWLNFGAYPEIIWIPDLEEPKHVFKLYLKNVYMDFDTNSSTCMTVDYARND